jgi:CHAT domain-containing protein
VARPFLAIGVPAVIASQWDVDDRGTQRLFIEFHRAFVRTQDAARSLQLAQMALLRSGDTELALPVRWGAFLALGTAAH